MSSSQTLASSTGIGHASGRAPSEPFDFVNSDIDDLASHMNHCAASQGRWSALRGNLQTMQAMAAGRIVTMACIAAAVGIAFLAFA